jgi:hypothetical protein
MTISEHFMLKKLSFFEAAAQLGVIFSLIRGVERMRGRPT